MDGASASTFRAGHFGESTMSMEAVQEFKVQTSGMSAEFGRMQAGLFNFVMQSGANQMHGSLYGAFRNEALNANTWVNNFRGVKRSPDRKQNAAASFGGPVYIPKIYNGKNKTFFYFAYERYRERTGGFGAPNRTLPHPGVLRWRLQPPAADQSMPAPTPSEPGGARRHLRSAIVPPARQRPLCGRYVPRQYHSQVALQPGVAEVERDRAEVVTSLPSATPPDRSR